MEGTTTMRRRTARVVKTHDSHGKPLHVGGLLLEIG
jgi:hypothetical protein